MKKNGATSIVKYPSKLLERLTSKLQILVYKLDNSGDTDILKNGELNFIKKVCDQTTGDFVFFDIGGNFGEYTELILQHLKTKQYSIHIFEPQKTCVRVLNEKFSDNAQIKINDYGLSDTESSQTLYRNKDGSGLASLYQRDLEHYNIQMDKTEEVHLIRSQTYIERHEIKHIDFMKIDVEGHEISVLNGFGEFLSPKNIDLIQFEYGGANLDSKTSLLDLFNLFHEKGFVLCKIMRTSLHKIDNYDPRFENYVYQNWVAVNPELLN